MWAPECGARVARGKGLIRREQRCDDDDVVMMILAIGDGCHALGSWQAVVSFLQLVPLCIISDVLHHPHHHLPPNHHRHHHQNFIIISVVISSSCLVIHLRGHRFPRGGMGKKGESLAKDTEVFALELMIDRGSLSITSPNILRPTGPWTVSPIPTSSQNSDARG